MKALIVGAFGIAILATPALAASAKYFVIVDTVGNCSITEKASAGQKVIGDTGGYDTNDAAVTKLQEIRKDPSVCKGVVE